MRRKFRIKRDSELCGEVSCSKKNARGTFFDTFDVVELKQRSEETMDYNLNRFKEVQSTDYPIALEEIKSGCKKSHWMWYIFPQLKDLGYSPTAKYYGIEGKDEANEAKRQMGNWKI